MNEKMEIEKGRVTLVLIETTIKDFLLFRSGNHLIWN